MIRAQVPFMKVKSLSPNHLSSPSLWRLDFSILAGETRAYRLQCTPGRKTARTGLPEKTD